MRAEQLSLPHFHIRQKGPVAILLLLKDIDNDPKVLMAERPSGRMTFPGGKLRLWEYHRPARGARRETREETGIRIYSDEYLIEFSASPIRVAVDRVERKMHVFYSFSDECAPSDTPSHREPKKMVLGDIYQFEHSPK